MSKVKYVKDKDGNRVPITAEHAPLTERNLVRAPRAPMKSRDSRASQKHEINKQRAAYQRMLRKNLFLLRAMRFPWAPSSIRYCRDLSDDVVRYRAFIVALNLRAEEFDDIPTRNQPRYRVRDTLHDKDVITEKEIDDTITSIVASAQAREIPDDEIDLGLDTESSGDD